jgi:hypothetical protein
MTDKEFVSTIYTTARCRKIGKFYEIVHRSSHEIFLLSGMTHNEESAWAAARYLIERQFLKTLSM